MRDAINASSASDPLFIIGAGPMHVIGEGINRAQKDKRQYVTLISHSEWNNKHQHGTSYTWALIKNQFANNAGGNLKMIQITDQNGGNGYDGMRADKSKFAWLNTSSARNNAVYESGSWAWLYDRQVAAQKNSDFDPSDAGMIIYLLTGVEKTDPSDAKKIMENPVSPCSSLKSETVATAIGENEVNLTVYPNPASESVTVSADVLIESISVAAFNGTAKVAETVINAKTADIAVADFQNGVYILTVKTSNGTVKQSIVKQ